MADNENPNEALWNLLSPPTTPKFVRFYFIFIYLVAVKLPHSDAASVG